MPMERGKFRLHPEPGTLEGAGEEGDQLVFYGSSLRQSGTGARLLTAVIKGGRGVRLTDSQVEELRDHLSAYLDYAIIDEEE